MDAATVDPVFAKVWADHNGEFRAACAKEAREYKELVVRVVRILSAHVDEYDREHLLDPDLVHVIDDGDYQGTQVFVTAVKGYQPSTYWATHTYYGSCGGCDTLQNANEDNDEKRVNAYMTLMLHLIQRMKKIT